MTISFDLAGQRLTAELFHELLIHLYGPLRLKRGIELTSQEGKIVTVPFLVDDCFAVEWLGPDSFCRLETIWNDEYRSHVISEHNFPKINVPYFLQLNSRVFMQLFGQEAELVNVPPSGFWNGSTLPCDFNSYGEDRFMDMYRQLPTESQAEVLDSLSQIQKELEWSVFGQTLVYKELLGPAALRNYYAANPKSTG